MVDVLAEIDAVNTAGLSFALERGIGLSVPINESIKLSFVQIPFLIYFTDFSSILSSPPDLLITISFSFINVFVSCYKGNIAPELTSTTVLAVGDCLIVDDLSGRIFRSRVKFSRSGEESIIVVESVVEL